MPRALILALLGSLLIHLALLFGREFSLLSERPAPLLLQAELRLPPPPVRIQSPRPVSEPPKFKKKPVPVATPEKKEILRQSQSSPSSAPPPEPLPEVAEAPAAASDPGLDDGPEEASDQPLQAMLPASGTIRFAIYKEALGMPVGRAEHHWEFAEDGSYVLTNMTETSGLVALFKPIRVEAESRGYLVASGLRPDSYHTWKNGEDNHNGAEFDWAKGLAHLDRDGSFLAIAPGAQDLLSLTYQLAYLKHPEAGSRIGIVTGRKFEYYQFESLGEEDVVVPAGQFRTLHLRAEADTTTEVWIALDLQRLPVKIRFTDKDGDRFLQLATEIGMRALPATP